MKTVYLVRHGESESNAGGVILGGAKTSLTQKGREQATFVAGRCARLALDAIVASPYLRTKQTAEIIAAHIGKPIEYSDLFVEWNMGSHRVGRQARDPELRMQLKSLIDHFKEPDWRVTDEENFEDLNKRASDALTYLEQHPQEHILLVGHGLFLRVLLGKAVMGDDFTGLDCEHFIKAFQTENTGITLLTHNRSPLEWSPWRIATWNDHAHLA